MTVQQLPQINKASGLEIGLYSIGDFIQSTDVNLSAKERLNQIIEMAKLAEDAGLDVFQLGESHQEHFISQAHFSILSAIAAKTDRIKLATGATIIGTSDPVRIFEDAATIDLISNERFELVCGRSARTGLFDLLGYSLNDYEELFEEKFKLLLEINNNEIVNWEGEFRSPLNDAHIIPRPDRPSKGLPIWRANAGTLNSSLKAAEAGIPLFLMHLRGDINHYAEIIKQYRQKAEEVGHQQLPVATAGFLLPKGTTAEAIDVYYPRIATGMAMIGHSKFDSDEFNKEDLKDSVSNIGSPDYIIEKILKQHEAFNHDRYVAQIDFGGTTIEEIKETIDILGNKIVPEVKKYTKNR